MCPSRADFDSKNVKSIVLGGYCFLFILHCSFYNALKLTFPLDIGDLSPEGTIGSKMGLGSMG